MQYVRTSQQRPADAARAVTALGVPLVVAVLMGALVVFAEAQAVIVSVSLVACVFIMLDFRFGVACLILLMPLAASTIFPHSMAGVTGLNPVNFLLLGTAISLAMRGLPEGSWARFAPRKLVWLYLIPLVVAGLLGARHVGEIPSAFNVAALISFDDTAGYVRDVLLKPVLFVVFAMLLGAAVARSRKPEAFLVPMMVSVWIMSLLTVFYVWHSGASLEQVSGSARNFLSPLGLHANDLGRLYAVAYALMLFTAASTHDAKLRLALIATMGVVVVALTFTFSRSAFFGFLLVSAIFLVSRRRLGVVLFGAAALAALAWVAPAAVYERMGAGWGDGLNAISAGRVDEIWTPLLPEVFSTPPWGNGLSSTLWAEATRSGRIPLVGHPHNAYLGALLDVGLLGLGLLAAYYVHVWQGFRRLARDTTLSRTERGFFSGASVGLVVFLVAGITGSSLTPTPESFYLWFAIGMMYGLIGRPAPVGVVAC